MGVQIGTLGLVISGQVRRKHDPDTDQTTLDMTMDQAAEAFAALGEVLAFFNRLPAQEDTDNMPLPGLG